MARVDHAARQLGVTNAFRRFVGFRRDMDVKLIQDTLDIVTNAFRRFVGFRLYGSQVDGVELVGRAPGREPGWHAFRR